jgi:hypothetical protein
MNARDFAEYMASKVTDEPRLTLTLKLHMEEEWIGKRKTRDEVSMLDMSAIVAVLEYTMGGKRYREFMNGLDMTAEDVLIRLLKHLGIMKSDEELEEEFENKLSPEQLFRRRFLWRGGRLVAGDEDVAVVGEEVKEAFEQVATSPELRERFDRLWGEYRGKVMEAAKSFSDMGKVLFPDETWD